MMVNTSNTTLKQGPKALNAVGVDLTIYVLRGTMLDNLMNIQPTERLISLVFIGTNSGTSFYFLCNDRQDSASGSVSNGNGVNLAITLQNTKYRHFSFDATPLVVWGTLVGVLILFFAANKSLVNLNLVS